MGAGPGSNENAWKVPRAKAHLPAVLWSLSVPFILACRAKAWNSYIKHS